MKLFISVVLTILASLLLMAAMIICFRFGYELGLSKCYDEVIYEPENKIQI